MFLGCFSDDDDPGSMYVPGLTADEGVELLESGQFEVEAYYDQRAFYVFQFVGDPAPWIDAKWRYAERVNQSLVKKIRATGRVGASIANPVPPARAGSR